MAHHKSAQKRNRQRTTRTTRNRTVRTRVRHVLKAARAALESAAPDALDQAKLAATLLDRAASKNVLPPRRVARTKSRLARLAQRSAKAGKAD